MDAYEKARLLEEVAKCIAGSDDPPRFWNWYLKPLLLGLSIDLILEKQQLSRRDLKRRMQKLVEGCDVTHLEISDPQVHRHLNGRSSYPLNPNQYTLEDVRRRAKDVLSDPEIVSPDGKLRRGAGPARFPGGCSVKRWIAVVISAAIEYRQGYPVTPCQKSAFKAAEKLWIACGGHRCGSQDYPLESWRKHFKQANAEEWAWAREMIHSRVAFYRKIVELRDAAIELSCLQALSVSGPATPQ